MPDPINVEEVLGDSTGQAMRHADSYTLSEMIANSQYYFAGVQPTPDHIKAILAVQRRGADVLGAIARSKYFLDDDIRKTVFEQCGQDRHNVYYSLARNPNLTPQIVNSIYDDQGNHTTSPVRGQYTLDSCLSDSPYLNRWGPEILKKLFLKNPDAPKVINNLLRTDLEPGLPRDRDAVNLVAKTLLDKYPETDPTNTHYNLLNYGSRALSMPECDPEYARSFVTSENPAFGPYKHVALKNPSLDTQTLKGVLAQYLTKHGAEYPDDNYLINGILRHPKATPELVDMVLGNHEDENAPSHVHYMLRVRALAANPSLVTPEQLRRGAKDASSAVKTAVAQNPNCPPETLKLLLKNKKSSDIVGAAAMNPKFNADLLHDVLDNPEEYPYSPAIILQAINRKAHNGDDTLINDAHLEKIARHPSDTVRMQLAQSSNLMTPRTWEILSKDPTPSIRASAFGSLTDDLTTPEMIDQGLADEDEYVRQQLFAKKRHLFQPRHWDSYIDRAKTVYDLNNLLSNNPNLSPEQLSKVWNKSNESPPDRGTDASYVQAQVQSYIAANPKISKGLIDQIHASCFPPNVPDINRLSYFRNVYAISSALSNNLTATAQMSPEQLKAHLWANPENWYKVPEMPMELLSARLNAPEAPQLSSAVRAAIAARFGEENPDAIHSERIHLAFDVGKLRKVRDMILATGKDEARAKDLPPGDWGVGRAPNGNISAKKLQEFIDKTPKTMLNISHSGWFRGQQHNTLPSNVFQVNITNDQIKKLKEAGVYTTWKNLKARFHYPGHPVTPTTLGWVRWTGGPAEWGTGQNGVFVDEVQSDLGQNFVKILSSEARAAALARRNAGENVPDEEVERLVREAEENANRQYPPAHMKAISQIVFGGKHSNELLHEAFQQWWREPHTSRYRNVIGGLKSSGSLAARMDIPPAQADEGFPDLDMQTHTEDTKKFISLGDPRKAVPVHFKMTYGEIPIKKLGWDKDKKYGDLETQKLATQYTHLPGATTIGGKVRKSEEIDEFWMEWFAPDGTYHYSPEYLGKTEFDEHVRGFNDYLRNGYKTDAWAYHGKGATPEQVAEALAGKDINTLKAMTATATMTPEQMEELWNYGMEMGSTVIRRRLVRRPDAPIPLKVKATHDPDTLDMISIANGFMDYAIDHPNEIGESFKTNINNWDLTSAQIGKLLSKPEWAPQHDSVLTYQANVPPEAKVNYLNRIAAGEITPRDSLTARRLLSALPKNQIDDFIGRLNPKYFAEALSVHASSWTGEQLKRLWDEEKVNNQDNGNVAKYIIHALPPDDGSGAARHVFNQALEDRGLLPTALVRVEQGHFQLSDAQQNKIVNDAFANGGADTGLQAAIALHLGNKLTEAQATEFVSKAAPQYAAKVIDRLGTAPFAPQLCRAGFARGDVHITEMGLAKLGVERLTSDDITLALDKLNTIPDHISSFLGREGNNRKLTPDHITKMLDKGTMETRYHIAHWDNLTEDHFKRLVNDKDHDVVTATMSNSKLPRSILDHVIDNGTQSARRTVAQNKNLSPEQQDRLFRVCEPSGGNKRDLQTLYFLIKNPSLSAPLLDRFLGDDDYLKWQADNYGFGREQWQNVNAGHARKMMASPYKSLAMVGVRSPAADLDDLKGAANNHRFQEVKDAAAGIIAIHDPDSVVKERVNVRFNTGKYRKIRDLIEAKGATALSPKELPQGDWNKNPAVKDKAGNISAELIQKYIDSMPAHGFNVSHGKGLTATSSVRHDPLFEESIAPNKDEAYAWAGGQRHNEEFSKLFLVHLTTDQVNRLKEAGVYNTYRKASSKSMNTGHPVTHTTLGWVRYTGNPEKGIFIDEAQSDFGQSFLRQYLNQVEARRNAGENVTEDEVSDFAREFPEDHFTMINKIVFGGKHSNEALHEAFQQYLRDRGHHKTKVATHSVESKAKISLGRPDATAPAHFQVTYKDVPQKRLGWEPSTYGTLATQSNEERQGQPTWEGIVRKHEEEWLKLLEPLEKARKASPAVQQDTIMKLLRHPSHYERLLALRKPGVTQDHLEYCLRSKDTDLAERAAGHRAMTPHLAEKLFSGEIRGPNIENAKYEVLIRNITKVPVALQRKLLAEGDHQTAEYIIQHSNKIKTADAKVALDRFPDKDGVLSSAILKDRVPRETKYLMRILSSPRVTRYNKFQLLGKDDLPAGFLSDFARQAMAGEDYNLSDTFNSYLSRSITVPREISDLVLDSKNADHIRHLLANSGSLAEIDQPKINALMNDVLDNYGDALGADKKYDLLTTLLEATHRYQNLFPPELLNKAFNHPNSDVQKAAFEQAGNKAPPEAVDHLLDQAMTTGRVRSQAKSLLSSLLFSSATSLTSAHLARMTQIAAPTDQNPDQWFATILGHPHADDTLRATILANPALSNNMKYNALEGLQVLPPEVGASLVQDAIHKYSLPYARDDGWGRNVLMNISGRKNISPQTVDALVKTDMADIHDSLAANNADKLTPEHRQHLFDVLVAASYKNITGRTNQDVNIMHMGRRLMEAKALPPDAAIQMADSNSAELHDVALKDPNLPSDRVAKIASQADASSGAAVFAHPNLPPEIIDNFLADPVNWRDTQYHNEGRLLNLLDNPNLQERHLKVLFDNLDGLSEGQRRVLYDTPAATVPFLEQAGKWELEEGSGRMAQYLGTELAFHNPDSLYPDKLDVRFDTGKLRKIRDQILGEGRADKPAKELPQGVWSQGNMFRAPNGNISAEKLQQFIDNSPPVRYNYSHGRMTNIPISSHGVDKEAGTWNGGQQHNGKPSKLMLLHVTTDQMNKLKEAGVYKSFRTVQKAHYGSSHPATPHSIGWVRYTGTPQEGIFIDEIQSDIGQAFNRQVHGDDTAEIPVEHYPIISKILFNGRHPNEAIHESFQQMLRDHGHHAARVSIHTPESKAGLSGVGTVENGRTVYPGHFYVTYKEVPQKRLGWEPTTYGTMPSQSNEELKGKPLWEGIVRKFEEVNEAMRLAKSS